LAGLPPPAVYAVIGTLAAVENVFPPVPADTAVALGAFLSQFGDISAAAVFAVTWTANVASASATYVASRTFGRRFFAGRVGRRILRPGALERIERLYQRYGTWGVFFSRFIPAVRAVVPPFAGLAKLGAVRTIVPLAAASAIWYGALTFVIATLASRLEDVRRLVGHINVVALAVVVVVVALVVGIGRLRRSG
jgi:membrane protein DedA with SNARE-associated domain